jgi:hypothetical protein
VTDDLIFLFENTEKLLFHSGPREVMGENEVEVKVVLYMGENLEEMERTRSRAETLLLEKGVVFRKEIEQMDIYLPHP